MGKLGELLGKYLGGPRSIGHGLSLKDPLLSRA